MADNLAFYWMDSIISRQYVRYNFKMDVILNTRSIPTTTLYPAYSANYVIPDDINPDTIFRN